MSPPDRHKPPNTGQPPDWPDPDDPPNEEELRAADALRRALEGRAGPSDEDAARAAGELAQSLRAAASPQALSPERHRQILDRALAAKPPREATRAPVVALRPAKSRAAYLALGGATSLVALAAAVALVIRGAAPERSMPSMAAVDRARPRLALSRSAGELFPEGIPRSGGTTDRVDRIAYARAQDFRQNQFARWGAP